jgi:hypothetical protein
MKPRRIGRKRRAVAGIILAALLFALIFTAGIGYLLFQSQADRNSYAANVQAFQGRQSASQEQIAFCAMPVSAGSCKAAPTGNALSVTVNDTGGFPISVTGWFVKDNATGKVLSSGVVQLASPLNLNVGNSGSFPLTGYNYVGGTILVSLVTSRGNVFTVQYPLSTTVTQVTQSSTTTTVTGPGSGGGNSLVVVMAATPVQAFSGTIITDNVTLFNYSNVPMTGATPVPAPPSYTTTGTAGLASTGCSQAYTPPGQVPDSSGFIPAWSGGGTAPHIYFLCTYTASSGAVGGLVSFSGAAKALQGTNTIYSAQATSNLVQVGGLTNPIAQGAFTSNFFFFKYSSCQPNAIAPSGGTSCTLPANTKTNYAGLPVVKNFPEADLISSGSNYYVAFYLNLTNTFNKPLPLLQYTFVQLESSAGNESDWWLVGTTAKMTNLVYYPTYNPASGPPTLTAYPTDCGTVDSNNVPTDSNCIYVKPGQTVTVTLAACGPGVAKWDWGGSQYGVHFDSLPAGVSCTSSTPYLNLGGSASGSATAAITVISFEYNGAVYTQDIAFQGVAFGS